jgi:thioredoxin reductase
VNAPRGKLCPHDTGQEAAPRAARCEGCGSTWNLRACTTCGHVGCCESQQGHNTAHARHASLIDEVRAEGVAVIDKQVRRLDGLQEDRVRLEFDDGSTEEFDKAWVSLGWYKVNNELARQLGARIDRDGYVPTTEDCEALGEDGAPLERLFVIGDLRAETWKQVPIALGDAESAIIHAFAARL